jgi:hypothetical protein
MIALVHRCGKTLRQGRWLLAAAILASGLSGCAGWPWHEDGFGEDDLSVSARAARAERAPPANNDKNINYWSFSEKGRQIERDLPAM